MEDDNGGKICSLLFPKLQHIASVNIILPYWKELPRIMIRTKPLDGNERSEYDAAYFVESAYGGPFNHSLNYYMISNVIAEIIESMSALFKKLPKYLVMRLLDLTITMGCEIFESRFSVLYDISKYFKNVEEVKDFYYLDCIVWSPLGNINHKETAKMLCQRPQLTDLHKYILSCNFCLFDEINKFSSKEVISFFLGEELQEFLSVFPMVGLFTKEISHLLPIRDTDLPLCEQVFCLLTANEKEIFFYDAAIQHIWDNFSEEQKSKYFLKIFKCLPSYITIHYVLSQVNNEQINVTCNSYGVEILLALIYNRLFQDKIVKSFEYVLPHLNDEGFSHVLDKVIAAIVIGDPKNRTGMMFMMFSSKLHKNACSRLFDRVLQRLTLKTELKYFKQKDILKEYNNYYYHKYGIVLNELWEYAQNQSKKYVLDEYDSRMTRLINCLLFLFNFNNISNISSVFKSVNYDKKFELIEYRLVQEQYMDFIFNGDFDSFNELICLFFSPGDEIERFKHQWFNNSFELLASDCIKRHSEHLFEKLNKFFEYFHGVVSDLDNNEQKLKLLHSEKVLSALFNKHFDSHTYKLNHGELDNFFKWCYNIVSNDELKPLKLKLFKNGMLSDSFLRVICRLFSYNVSTNRKLIDKIICWVVDNDPSYIDAIKEDFCKNDSQCLLELIIEKAAGGVIEEFVKELMNWCFPLVNSDDDKINLFSKEILRNEERITYILTDLIINEEVNETDLICNWYCNYFGLNIKQLKNELILSENLMCGIFKYIDSHYGFDMVMDWFSPTSSTMQIFRNKFQRQDWYEHFRNAIDNYVGS